MSALEEIQERRLCGDHCADSSPAEALLRRMRLAHWRLIDDGCRRAAENMALDAALLALAERPVLRFYGWMPPAVSLGRFQRLEGIDFSQVRMRGWDVVRRPTGGRAVLHQHEVTYAIVLPAAVAGGTGVRSSYAALTGLLNSGIGTLLREDLRRERRPSSRPQAGHTANCFALADECDSITAYGKLAGSAQVRRGGALLQHGSILLDADPGAWTALFGSPGRLVTLRKLLGAAPPRRAVTAAAAGAFVPGGCRLLPGDFSPDELALARQLEAEFVLPGVRSHSPSR